MPYVYIIDYAIAVHVMDWYASFLLSIAGLGRIVGQIVFGILGDVKHLSPSFLFIIGCVVAGLCTAVVPLCAQSYASLGVYAALFGAGASVTYVLPMICLVEILGLDRAVNAFGFLQLVQGVATLIGTPVAGRL
jgi:MFS family permease